MRFIPTCVGNIRNCQRLIGGFSVHPHVCGEHVVIMQFAGGVGGSSPRVWGTSLPCTTQRPTRRFIPTCVGNIKANVQTRVILPVHPHVCGEHDKCHLLCGWQSGSSPRVWGTLIYFFIQRPLNSVHPHVCGEHIKKAICPIK